jgi:hypothetical protein
MGPRGPPSDQEDLTWTILLAFAAGFASIAALVLFVLDLAGFEAGAGREGDGQ